jgi:uncharacterized protein
MNMKFPYGTATNGLTATSNEETHIRELIETLLFTQPGERVNRPTFGAGAAQLVFALNSNELAAATQLLIQGNLQQNLGDRISVDNVQVASEDSTLSITISYTVRSTSGRGNVTFVKAI